jgi:2-succinyl-6-hydroxy-2,4-cyclohexadiene-1-carboxylate synthase
MEAFVARWERMPLFATQERLPETVRARLRAARLANHPGGLANSLRGMGTGVQPSFWPRLGELKIPCLIMAGELDAKFRAIAQNMADAIAGSRLALVPEAGHTIHLEQPAAFARLVLEFAAGGRLA